MKQLKEHFWDDIHKQWVYEFSTMELASLLRSNELTKSERSSYEFYLANKLFQEEMAKILTICVAAEIIKVLKNQDKGVLK